MTNRKHERREKAAARERLEKHHLSQYYQAELLVNGRESSVYELRKGDVVTITSPGTLEELRNTENPVPTALGSVTLLERPYKNASGPYQLDCQLLTDMLDYTAGSRVKLLYNPPRGTLRVQELTR